MLGSFSFKMDRIEKHDSRICDHFRHTSMVQAIGEAVGALGDEPAAARLSFAILFAAAFMPAPAHEARFERRRGGVFTSTGLHFLAHQFHYRCARRRRSGTTRGRWTRSLWCQLRRNTGCLSIAACDVGSGAGIDLEHCSTRPPSSRRKAWSGERRRTRRARSFWSATEF